MIIFIRCSSEDEEFVGLTRQLDLELRERNGKKQELYKEMNVVSKIDTAILIKKEGIPIGCGCFKEYDKDTIELKRVFVKTAYRGNGYSNRLIQQLEQWAHELGFHRIILETGRKQTEAIGLYRSNGYKEIKNYGPYIEMTNSICFEKYLDTDIQIT